MSGGGSAAASATGDRPDGVGGRLGRVARAGRPRHDAPTPRRPSAPARRAHRAAHVVVESAAASPAAPSEGGTSGASAAPAAPSTPANAATTASARVRHGSQAQARLLAVRYGAPTGDEIPLIGQRLVVGRFDPETGPVDIDLSESAESGHISRQHGELYREGDGSWMVRDLGSTNGVFVKSGDAASFGPRITAPRPLQDGDEVAFGNARFIFKTS